MKRTKLTREQRGAIILHAVAGASYKQIAKRVGCTPWQARFYGQAYKPPLTAAQTHARSCHSMDADLRREVRAARVAMWVAEGKH